MQLLRSLALLAGVASVATAAAIDTAQDDFADEWDIEERGGCPMVQVVAAGGEGTTEGDLGYLQSTADGVLAAIPHSKLHQIPYPPGADSADAIAAGVPLLQQHIPKFAKRCPHSKMFLLGYSAGAVVTGNTLCGDALTGADPLATHFRHNIIGVVLYGDPTFLLGKSYDKGTCTSSPSVDPRIMPGECFPYGGKMQSYCDEGDPECCDGTDTNVHFEYPGLYDGDVAKFAKAKYHYWRSHM